MNGDLSYWEDLAERYFQAETTDEEEARLRKFLCSDAAHDPRFDEVRATMSYLYVAQDKIVAPPPLPLWRRAVGGSAARQKHSLLTLKGARGSRAERGLLFVLAACLSAIAFLGWQQYRQYNLSTVRMAGEDIEADASLLMQQQMTEMFNPIDQNDR